MHAMFGLTGGVAAVAGGVPEPDRRGGARRGGPRRRSQPVWLETDHGKVTPGQIREQLDVDDAAVAVSLVDFRTGYLADLEGIRQVIGDRLLIVDAIQGFGVVDAAVRGRRRRLGGGQKWLRAGWGTGFLALGDAGARAPHAGVLGLHAAPTATMPMDEVPPPARGARRVPVSATPTRSPQARLAAALEEIAAVGVRAIDAAIAERVERRDRPRRRVRARRCVTRATSRSAPASSCSSRRAGRSPSLAASLHNHGVTVTVAARAGAARARTPRPSDETLDMLRGAFVSYGTAASY